MSDIQLPHNVQDAIRDNLPGHISKVLRTELERGQQAIEKERDLLQANAQLKNQLSEHISISAARKNLKKANEHLDDRVSEVRTREERQRSFELEIKLAAEQKLSEALSVSLQGLVRNVEWRKSIRD